MKLKSWRCACGVLSQLNRVCGASAFCPACWKAHAAAEPFRGVDLDAAEESEAT